MQLKTGWGIAKELTNVVTVQSTDSVLLHKQFLTVTTVNREFPTT